MSYALALLLFLLGRASAPKPLAGYNEAVIERFAVEKSCELSTVQSDAVQRAFVTRLRAKKLINVIDRLDAPFLGRLGRRRGWMLLAQVIVGLALLGMALTGPAAGLTTREACGNTVRNVTSCPLAGICAGESFDVTPYALGVTRFLLRHPEFHDLPRKF